MIIPIMKCSWRIITPPNACRILHSRQFLYQNFRLDIISPASIHHCCPLQTQSISKVKSLLKTDNKNKENDDDSLLATNNIDKYLKQIEHNRILSKKSSVSAKSETSEPTPSTQAVFDPTPLDCLKLLEEIVKSVKDTQAELSTEKREQLVKIGEFLSKDDFNKWHLPTLPVLYSHLMNLYLDEDTKLIQKVVNTIKWQLPRVPINAAVLCYILQSKYNMDQNIKKESGDVITERISEISNVKTIQKIISNQDCFSEEFLFNVDKNLLILVDLFNVKDSLNILLTYSTCKRRAVFVLAAIARRLANEEEFELEDASNLLYAFSGLNFEDEVLFEKISSSVLNSIKSAEDSVIVGSLSMSMGKLRWKNVKLLDSLSQWICNNIDKCREKDLVSLVFTLASVNYIPKCGENLKKILQEKVNITDKFLQVDFVWALTILGWANHAHFENVLNIDFKSLDGNSFRVKKCIQKLQNINEVAKTLNKYKGALFNYDKTASLPLRKSKLALKEAVLKSLKASFPPPLYLNTKSENYMGFDFVAEILVDTQGRSLPLKGFSSNFKERSFTKQQLKGLDNLVFFAWDYQDYTIGEVDLLGSNQMFLNIMKNKGYKCVEISHSEFNSLNKVLDKVNYINRKIAAIVSTQEGSK